MLGGKPPEGASAIDMEAGLERQQDKERPRRLLQDLPERQRDLIALKYGAGLTKRQIAGLTRLSETNVGSILHRTVRDLRHRWSEDDGR